MRNIERIVKKVNVDKFNPRVEDYFIRTTSNMDIEDITVQELTNMELYAVNLTKLIRTSNSEAVVERRFELREELHRVVSWLYKFNINQTNLLTRV